MLKLYNEYAETSFNDCKRHITCVPKLQTSFNDCKRHITYMPKLQKTCLSQKKSSDILFENNSCDILFENNPCDILFENKPCDILFNELNELLQTSILFPCIFDTYLDIQRMYVTDILTNLTGCTYLQMQ